MRGAVAPLSCFFCCCSAWSTVWFPKDPGPARYSDDGREERIFNAVLGITVGSNERSFTVENSLNHGRKLEIEMPSVIGAGYRSKGVWLASGATRVRADKASSVAGRHEAGWAIHRTLTDALNGYRLELTIELRNGSNYIRESLRVSRVGGFKPDGTASRIDMVGVTDPDAKVVGDVPGSPIVDGNFFLGAEFPMSASLSAGGRTRSSILRKVPLTSDHPATYGAVVGVAGDGQMRRAVLRYVERERAHPYRAFLHYNSWYDLGYFTPYTADQCVERINAFGQALTVKRGVKLSSFLFDDGWDDYQGVWKVSKAFPDGFLPLKRAAAKYDAGPGVWLSPWGGYGRPRTIRLAAGSAAGYEVDSQGYALSGPKYFARFKNVTLDFVKNQGINQFKFDGTGSPDKQYPGSPFDSDFAAAISLIGDLRAARPDLFINLTTGTWPSPFWLQYADSTWRGGADHSFAGVGPYREQWITYRDGDTYNGVVRRGPLYPLNSLMLHGLIYAQHANHLNSDPSDDLKNDIRSYFATGTQLQELYVTPTLLTEKNWDDLAEAANWAKANEGTLVDTHWVGGDPMKLEVYGHAAWNGSNGIIEIRNPSDHAQAYALDVARDLQLPPTVHGTFRTRDPFKSDGSTKEWSFRIGTSKVVLLKPFEVLILEGRAGR